MRRPAVEADDGDLVRTGLDRLEQLRRELRPRRLEHGVAIGRDLRAHDREELDRDLMRRDRTAGGGPVEHLLEPAVARQQGALAVLDGHAQHQKVPAMARYSVLASRQRRQAWF